MPAVAQQEAGNPLDTCYLTFLVAEGVAECAILYRDISLVVDTIEREHRCYDIIWHFRQTLNSLQISYKMRLLP